MEWDLGGRPNMQWIDCINEDLKPFNISNNPKDKWRKMRVSARSS